MIETLQLIVGLFVGTLVVLSRLTSMVLVLLLNLTRLDVCVLPHGWHGWDSAHMAFYSVCVADHRLQNPIMRAFLVRVCVCFCVIVGIMLLFFPDVCQ